MIPQTNDDKRLVLMSMSLSVRAKFYTLFVIESTDRPIKKLRWDGNQIETSDENCTKIICL